VNTVFFKFTNGYKCRQSITLVVADKTKNAVKLALFIRRFNLEKHENKKCVRKEGMIYVNSSIFTAVTSNKKNRT